MIEYCMLCMCPLEIDDEDDLIYDRNGDGPYCDTCSGKLGEPQLSDNGIHETVTAMCETIDRVVPKAQKEISKLQICLGNIQDNIHKTLSIIKRGNVR